MRQCQINCYDIKLLRGFEAHMKLKKQIKNEDRTNKLMLSANMSTVQFWINIYLY